MSIHYSVYYIRYMYKHYSAHDMSRKDLDNLQKDVEKVG